MRMNPNLHRRQLQNGRLYQIYQARLEWSMYNHTQTQVFWKFLMRNERGQINQYLVFYKLLLCIFVFESNGIRVADRVKQHLERCEFIFKDANNLAGCSFSLAI